MYLNYINDETTSETEITNLLYKEFIVNLKCGIVLLHSEKRNNKKVENPTILFVRRIV